MPKQVTIDLDDEVLVFLDRHSGGNLSEYINKLLRRQRRSAIEAELAAAHQQDAQNPEYRAEIALWDAVVADGIGDDADA
ncbi:MULTISPECIES: CopG family transcriptional regulator [Argonema]|uniref:type II toxin-antitoxin system MazE family antitoxin n=1 Tax=Argonema TaxID=2942761 RepID=UPI002012B9C0|nr:MULTISPECIES: CopG family transcriptional regulator [Argonema]MCL1465538.1 CopG family transcriptional regulator [Argonema galeatum A003/A1]MCL1475174.1 CopG family transcriptional regulator [Argonema antarcticum A004/B2]